MIRANFIERWLDRFCEPAGVRACVQAIEFREDHARCTEKARAILAPVEFARFQRLRSAKRASEFLAGRIAAKRLLCQAPFGLDDSECVVSTSSAGAPFIEGRAGIHVSISHSGSVAVAVAATHRIGIDIEENVDRPTSLLRFFYGPRERAVVDAMEGEKRTAFVNELWCRKEAACKVGHWGAALCFSDLEGLGARVTVEDSVLGLRSGVVDGLAAALAWETSPGFSAAESRPKFATAAHVTRTRVTRVTRGQTAVATIERGNFGTDVCVRASSGPFGHIEAREVRRG
ncbi:MAG: 4'-phosphopantetheinyl transferase superfamily protein [Polyangiaceae bacterium]